jgi:PKD repeat protein
MKNKILLLIIFIPLARGILISNSYAQMGEWTWMHGDNFSNAPGVFGTQGVADPANKPPGMYETCEWKDNNGNFWLFGGYDFNGANHAALWKYDPIINQWAWMKGPSGTGTPGVYGTQGISDPANYPGARTNGACTWVDASGNLWLFGGSGYDAAGVAGQLNDLWKYTISTNEWTWMKGPNTANDPGFYGTQGVSNPANLPPSRKETSCSWTDNAGNLWLYGGGETISRFGDLWKYDITINEWTWMKGANTGNPPAVYGTQGVADPANTPGGRWVYASWKDLAGNLWLSSGNIGGVTFILATNDLWKYDIVTNQWTWMKGTGTIDDPGSYGTKCVSAAANNPPARMENRARVRDACGNFWNFGGYSTPGYLNDLWQYNVSTNQWTWVSGDNTSNQSAIYGTQGVSNPANKPGGKRGSVSWADNNGYIWIFGGFDGSNCYNDLFRYVPDSLCAAACMPLPVALFNAPTEICPGTCINFNNLSVNSNSYLWTFAGANPGTSTDANPQNICYPTPGNYDVQLIATNANGSDTLQLSNFITVFPSPAPQGITQIGDTLFANAGAVSYQWYYSGNAIAGATDYYYVAQSSGSYNVVCTDANGCEVEAVIFDVVAGIFSGGARVDMQLELYPNPVEDQFTIQWVPGSQLIREARVEISIYNVVGGFAVHLPASYCILPACSIDVHTLPKGMYWIEVTSGEKVFRNKFVKQ